MKMKVRMRVSMSGERLSNQPGDEVEFEEEAAHAQVKAGHAEYLSKEDELRAPDAAARRKLLRVKNLVSWAGHDFSYVQGDIIALPPEVAHARVAAGRCAYLSAEDALTAAKKIG